MGVIGADTCAVCKVKPSKYRCPGCTAPYCSLACNKAHKSRTAGGKSICAGKRRKLRTSAQGNDGRAHTPGKGKRPKRASNSKKEAKKDASEKASSGVSGCVASSGVSGCVRNPRDQWRGGKMEEDEEEEWRMSEDQRAKLPECEWLKAALRDLKLQSLLTEIDNADDRQETLAFHRTSKEFGEFMDKLLLEIGEYRKGEQDEPALVAADA